MGLWWCASRKRVTIKTQQGFETSVLPAAPGLWGCWGQAVGTVVVSIPSVKQHSGGLSLFSFSLWLYWGGWNLSQILAFPSVDRRAFFRFVFFFLRKDYVIYIIFNFNFYIKIFIYSLFNFIYLYMMALLVQMVAFLLHWCQWSLISVKSVKCVPVTFIGEENKALVSLTLRLFGEYLAASTQMYIILCICTNSINTNQSQCWIFNSQNTVIQLSVFSYQLCLWFGGVISKGSFLLTQPWFSHQ